MCRYLVKPSDPAELRAVVRDSLRFYELQRENRRLYELSASQAMALRQLNEGLERKVAERTAVIEDRNHELENNLLDLIRLLASVQEMRQAGQAGGVAEHGRGGRRAGPEPREQYDIEVAATLHDLAR
jgi:response regulator RpfG family c-di-GMP phosphodiesterase